MRSRRSDYLFESFVADCMFTGSAPGPSTAIFQIFYHEIHSNAT